MKIFLTILALLIAIPVYATTLYQYYGGELPPLEERALIYNEAFVDTYEGTFEQNTNFLSYLQYSQFNESELTLTLGSFRPSNYVGKLLTRLNEGGAESTFNTTPDEAADGTGLSTTKLGDFIVFTINPGASNEEKISVSAVATSSNEATWTIINRGLSFTENVSITGNINQHAIGETVIISNDDHYLSQQFLEKGENQTITSVLTFSILPESSLEATTSPQFVTKALLDNTTNAGAATSTEERGGLVELGTLAEQADSFDGGLAKPTVLQTKNSTSTCQIVGSYNVVASTTGKIDKGCIDQTSTYEFSGAQSHSATSTFNSGVDIEADAVAPVIFNGIELVFPSTNGASSTSLSGDGGTPNVLTWNALPDGFTLLSNDTIGGGPFATTSIFASAVDLRIIIDHRGCSAACALEVYFNSDASKVTIGNKTFEDGVITSTNNGLTRGMVLGGNATTSAVFFVVNVNNQTSSRKFVNWTGTSNNSGSNVPKYYNGAGVWNNTSAQITNLVFTTGDPSTTNINASMNVRVYGR